jgi:hypothetical protein
LNFAGRTFLAPEVHNRAEGYARDSGLGARSRGTPLDQFVHGTPPPPVARRLIVYDFILLLLRREIQATRQNKRRLSFNRVTSVAEMQDRMLDSCTKHHARASLQERYTATT